MANSKKITLNEKIDPLSELRKSDSAFAWITKDSKFLKTKIKPIEVKRTMVLDGRKWKEKALKDGIRAVARYDLKIFAVTASTCHKKASGSPINEAAQVKQVVNVYEKIREDVLDKVSLALDEIEADKGESKTAIKDGRTAFKKSAKPKNIDLYQELRTAMTKMFATLVLEIRNLDLSRQKNVLDESKLKALKEELKNVAASDNEDSSSKENSKSSKENSKRKKIDLEERVKDQEKFKNDDDKGRDKALSNGANTVDSAKQKYTSARKDIEQWIEKPKKMLEGIKGKDLPEAFMIFRERHYSKLKSDVEAVKDSLEAFENEVDQLARKLKSLQGNSGPRNRTQKDIVKVKSDFQTNRAVKNGGVILSAFDKKFEEMKKEFKKLENEFK